MSAEAWPSWISDCYDHILQNDSVDVVKGSLCIWAGSGSENVPIVSTLAIGLIPIFLAIMVYVRYQKIAPSLFVMVLGVMLIKSVETFYDLVLVSPWAYGIMYTIIGLGIALAVKGFIWNKN